MKSIVESLFVGIPKPLKRVGMKSAINKTRVDKISVKRDHIEGDQVSNLKYHGGNDRVIHQYAAENYSFLETKYLKDSFIPGSLGENISSRGMMEQDVCLGDIYQIGGVKGMVSEAREPCGIIDLNFGVKGAHLALKSEMRLGWFYKILEEGMIKEGDGILLVERPFPELSLRRCIQGLLIKKSPELALELMRFPFLSRNWKILVDKLLPQ